MTALKDKELLKRMKAGGVAFPKTALKEARRVPLNLSLACALLEQETAGGHNVFGHDPAPNGRTVGGAVTKVRYLIYRHWRGPRGEGGMQGVGPLQLTYFAFQDAADHAGGCHRPTYNMRIGFEHIAQLIHSNGYAKGIELYNGSGPAAVAYSASVRAKAKAWHTRLTQEKR